MRTCANAPRWAKPVAVVAGVFGGMTVMSGGSVLLSEAARQAAGDYVPFVVWFNTLAGFSYVAAAVALWQWRRWAAPLSLAIAVATLLAGAGFGLHVMAGGAYEMRTVGALALRFSIWAAIAAVTRRAMS